LKINLVNIKLNLNISIQIWTAVEDGCLVNYLALQILLPEITRGKPSFCQLWCF